MRDAGDRASRERRRGYRAHSASRPFITMSRTSTRMIARPAPAPDAATLLACLRRREQQQWMKIAGLTTLGLGFLTFGPILLGTIIWARGTRRHYADYPTTWFGAVMVASVCIIPLLFLLEWATRGLFFENVAESAGDSYFGRRMAGRAFLIEMLLWGPRMLLSAGRRLRSGATYRGVDRALAAQMLAKLVRSDEGIPIGQVFDASNPVAVPTLTYLTYFDWVDLSKNGDRIWVLSDARKVLCGR